MKTTDITFLKNLKRASGGRNSPKKVRARWKGVARLLAAGKTYNQIAKLTKTSSPFVAHVRQELNAALKAGFKTVESYLAAGRPCNKAKEKLA